DSRLTPDMGDFLVRTKQLIEQTYRNNGNRPVHLVGHSNGPLYAQYLLTHTSRGWKHRYIHGFTPIAGNFPGQGALYPLLFSGIDTLVGLGLRDLTVGQLLDDNTTFFTRDGDINQEDITNEAVGAWTAMTCFRFSLTDNPGIDHFSLPSDGNVVARLIHDANRPRSNCK